MKAKSKKAPDANLEKGGSPQAKPNPITNQAAAQQMTQEDFYAKFHKLPVKVQRVVVGGLSRTKDDVVEKEIKPLLECKTFEEMVHRSYNVKVKMERLGLFKKVDIQLAVSKDKTENGYEILFDVQEYKRIVAGGIKTEISNNDGSVNLNLVLPNLNGRGERLDLEYYVGTKHSHGWRADLRKPINNNPDILAGALAFQTHGDYPWSGFKQTERGILLDLTFPSFIGAHNLQWEGVWRDLRALTRETSFAVREQAGHTLKSAVKHTCTIDTRDNKLIPSTGILWRTCQEYAGIGGNVEFAKQDGTFQWNASLPWDTIFQVSVAGGMMQPLDPARPVLINDRFFLGGPLNLRGFQLHGCGPHSHENALGSEAYWVSALHLYSPLPFRPGKGRFGDFFKTHFFVTAGNLGPMNLSNFQNCVRNLAENYRWSYGLGLVLMMGNLARLELNYVYPMRIQKGDKANPGLQFGIGFNFL